MAGEHPIVVIAVREMQLRVLGIDALLNGMRLAKIEGRSADSTQFPGGDERARYRCKSLCMELRGPGCPIASFQ
jgi:hypothetical protein